MSKVLKDIFVEATPKTPEIDFNPVSGNLILSGKSIPENAAKVYEPLVDWIKEYIITPAKTTNLRINLMYFNTATSIWVARIIRTLSSISKPDSVLFIHLYVDVEDSDILDMEEVRDIIGAMVDNIDKTVISIGIIVYGLDEKGKIVKESKVFI